MANRNNDTGANGGDVVGWIVGSVIALGTGLGVLVIIWLQHFLFARREQFRRQGFHVKAVVTRTGQEEDGWWVHYRFVDQAGDSHHGCDTLNSNEHQRPEVGSCVEVVYLPDSPWVSGLGTRWLNKEKDIAPPTEASKERDRQ